MPNGISEAADRAYDERSGRYVADPYPRPQDQERPDQEHCLNEVRKLLEMAHRLPDRAPSFLKDGCYR